VRLAPGYPAGQKLDTAEEQAAALLHDLRESFAPSYLTLISIIEGVLLGLAIELVATRHIPVAAGDPAILLAFNNLLLIILVWNEYRMGSSMFRWIPSLPDAIIPFTLGGLQATLLLTMHRPMAWLMWLAAFYAAAGIAFGNMYYCAGKEQRNAFVIACNRQFQGLNVVLCLGLAGALALMAVHHALRGTPPGWASLTFVTLINAGFLLRGEVNWRVIVAATRSMAERHPDARPRARAGNGFAMHPAIHRSSGERPG
jgi:hypothetical protein